MDTHTAFEGMIQGAGIPYAIVLYHVKGNDDREKIKYDKILGTALVRVVPIFVVDAKKEPAYRQVLFRMMMYAHTKS